jgi:hypothetical protein
MTRDNGSYREDNMACCMLCDDETELLESEVVNLSANEAWVLKLCLLCVMLAGGTVNKGSDGNDYVSLGCVGGTTEETQ